MRLKPFWRACVSAALLFAPTVAYAQANASRANADPRVGLGAGWMDAKQASRNMILIANHPRPDHFVNPASLGDFGVINSDLAFKGNFVFQGNFNGFQV